MTWEEILLYPMVAFFPLFFHVHSQWIEKAGFVRKMNRGLSIDFGGGFLSFDLIAVSVTVQK